eukprot:Selendium_serpulae@DN4847_c1_g1_i1.p1
MQPAPDGEGYMYVQPPPPPMGDPSQYAGHNETYAVGPGLHVQDRGLVLPPGSSPAYSEVSDVMAAKIRSGQPILSKQLSTAVSRGERTVEKKANWAFDYYQITNNYPVDYKYWWTPYTQDTGETQFTMMHAIAYAEDGSEFGADLTLDRRFMREAHKMAIRGHILKQMADREAREAQGARPKHS